MYFLTYELKGKQAVGLLTADHKQVIPLVAAREALFKKKLPICPKANAMAIMEYREKAMRMKNWKSSK